MRGVLGESVFGVLGGPCGVLQDPWEVLGGPWWVAEFAIPDPEGPRG